jgi:hypothetical protein
LVVDQVGWIDQVGGAVELVGGVEEHLLGQVGIGAAQHGGGETLSLTDQERVATGLGRGGGVLGGGGGQVVAVEFEQQLRGEQVGPGELPAGPADVGAGGEMVVGVGEQVGYAVASWV